MSTPIDDVVVIRRVHNSLPVAASRATTPVAPYSREDATVGDRHAERPDVEPVRLRLPTRRAAATVDRGDHTRAVLDVDRLPTINGTVVNVPVIAAFHAGRSVPTFALVIVESNVERELS